jgi:hypothetical protein
MASFILHSYLNLFLNPAYLMFVFLFLVGCRLVIILCFKVLCVENCNCLFQKIRHIEM